MLRPQTAGNQPILTRRMADGDEHYFVSTGVGVRRGQKFPKTQRSNHVVIGEYEPVMVRVRSQFHPESGTKLQVDGSMFIGGVQRFRVVFKGPDGTCFNKPAVSQEKGEGEDEWLDYDEMFILTKHIGVGFGQQLIVRGNKTLSFPCLIAVHGQDDGLIERIETYQLHTAFPDGSLKYNPNDESSNVQPIPLSWADGTFKFQGQDLPGHTGKYSIQRGLLGDEAFVRVTGLDGSTLVTNFMNEESNPALSATAWLFDKSEFEENGQSGLCFLSVEFKNEDSVDTSGQVKQVIKQGVLNPASVATPTSTPVASNPPTDENAKIGEKKETKSGTTRRPRQPRPATTVPTT